MTAYRILVLGGYGHFGGRVCRALMHHATLIVAGRDGAKAEKFARDLGAAHQGVAIDCSASALAERVRALRADAVVHTCGPFQGQDYHVARACMAAGTLSVRGAMPCMGLMTLAEFAEAVAVANLDISWRTFFK